jgi:hypothetical protein
MKPNPFGFNLNFDEFFGVKRSGSEFENRECTRIDAKVAGGRFDARRRPIWWGEAPEEPEPKTDAATID